MKRDYKSICKKSHRQKQEMKRKKYQRKIKSELEINKKIKKYYKSICKQRQLQKQRLKMDW